MKQETRVEMLTVQSRGAARKRARGRRQAAAAARGKQQHPKRYLTTTQALPQLTDNKPSLNLLISTYLPHSKKVEVSKLTTQ
jgi:hypothetical protein